MRDTTSSMLDTAGTRLSLATTMIALTFEGLSRRLLPGGWLKQRLQALGGRDLGRLPGSTGHHP
jgi:hypothetical protein